MPSQGWKDLATTVFSDPRGWGVIITTGALYWLIRGWQRVSYTEEPAPLHLERHEAVIDTIDYLDLRHSKPRVWRKAWLRDVPIFEHGENKEEFKPMARMIVLVKVDQPRVLPDGYEEWKGEAVEWQEYHADASYVGIADMCQNHYEEPAFSDTMSQTNKDDEDTDFVFVEAGTEE